MAYIKGEDRRQYILFPNCIDEYVGEDDPVRLFDAFVDKLDMEILDFKRFVPADTGTPGYDPRDLLKLYIYGYFYRVRSSRRLERECKCNIEVMWLIRKLTPDFRTIADFRKDNKTSMKKVFKEFNRFCLEVKLFSRSYVSIDGSKFKAVNAKDKNFTLNKIDDRLKRLDEHIAIFMEELDEYDDAEGRRLPKEEIERKLAVCQKRKEKYEGYKKQMEESGESQISLTDPDAKLMKANEGFCVGYNNQTAVDAESHLIAGFSITDSPTDHGQMNSLAEEVKEDLGVAVLETTADKGYAGAEDHAAALASGIVPNVIQQGGGCTEKLSYDYHEAEISEEQKASTKPEDLKACLEAGVIPDAYEGILTDMEVKEVRRLEHDDTDSAVASMTKEQMIAKAREGFFVRDTGCNLVYCPQGEILRQKSLKKNGMIRYCNKLACKHCKHKCTKSEFKEADFTKDQLIKTMGAKGRAKEADKDDKDKPPRKMVKKKIVSYVLHLDENKMNNRKCLSEHPFGTLKRTLEQYYFLLRGKLKVEAEMALFCLSYNLRRAINMKGVPALMAALR